mmetsp:Transcript_13399/g.20959  ORF Transcript_13399/g.20959 Transcript_13399/m.20959 type:complete len:147 (+) Transcript_13399:272-712(+)
MSTKKEFALLLRPLQRTCSLADQDPKSRVLAVSLWMFLRSRLLQTSWRPAVQDFTVWKRWEFSMADCASVRNNLWICWLLLLPGRLPLWAGLNEQISFAGLVNPEIRVEEQDIKVCSWNLLLLPKEIQDPGEKWSRNWEKQRQPHR